MLLNALGAEQKTQILNETQPDGWGQGRQLLGLATELGNKEDITVLVKHGADVDGKDINGIINLSL